MSALCPRPATATVHAVCQSSHNIATAVTAYAVILTVIMVWLSRQFLVAREVAVVGPNSPSRQRVSFLHVLEMVQTRLGVMVNSVILAAVFRAAMYNALVTM